MSKVVQAFSLQVNGMLWGKTPQWSLGCSFWLCRLLFPVRFRITKEREQQEVLQKRETSMGEGPNSFAFNSCFNKGEFSGGRDWSCQTLSRLMLQPKCVPASSAWELSMGDELVLGSREASAILSQAIFFKLFLKNFQWWRFCEFLGN